MSARDIAPRQVGWVGTGQMGGRMYPLVQAAGHDVVVYARSGVVAAGVRTADRPAEVCRGSGVVVTIVGGPPDVEALYLEDGGLIDAAAPDTVLVDMTTSSPALARHIDVEARKRGLAFVDAPVSGGPVAAESGSLSIMLGGDAETLESISWLLDIVGKTVVHHGPAGNGQAAKAVNQVLVAASMLGIVEAFSLASASKLDLGRVLETVQDGVVGSPLLGYMWPRLEGGDFNPGFRVAHLMKDLGIALEQAEAERVAMPGTAFIRELYRIAAAIGGESQGTQALIQAVRPMSSGKTEG